MSQEVSIVEQQHPVVVSPHTEAWLSIEELKARRHMITQLLSEIMQPEIHYGVIPGTQKPALLKAGAELICSTFRLAPRYDIEREDLGDWHRNYKVQTTLYHIGTQAMCGEGVGSCSTHETKYRYRAAERTCPACGQPAIIKGKAEYGGGWLCFKNKGGCGAKYKDGDAQITEQATGKVDNPDIADVYNTVLKMAKKRSLVDAVLTATAASDMFYRQDEEGGLEEGSAGERTVRTEATPSQERAVTTSERGQAKNVDPTQSVQHLNEAQIKSILQLADTLGVSEERIATHLTKTYEGTIVWDVPASKYTEILTWLKKQKG